LAPLQVAGGSSSRISSLHSGIPAFLRFVRYSPSSSGFVIPRRVDHFEAVSGAVACLDLVICGRWRDREAAPAAQLIICA
jgi:hypothetical protein